MEGARARTEGERRVLVEFNQEELVRKWEEFFDEVGYEPRIIGVADRYPEQRSLEVAFEDLNRFDTDMAIFLLRQPLNVLAAANEAVRRVAPAMDLALEIHVRVTGLPRDSRVAIRDLRAKHLGALVSLEGLVRKATEVRPQVTDASFECLRCGAVIKEPQEGTNFREPLECYEDQGGCKRSASSTKFKLLGEASRFVDTQKVEVQEAPEGLRGGEEPQRLSAYLEDDLTGRIAPGQRVVLNGVLRSSQRGRPGARSTLFDIFVDTNSVEFEQVEFEEIEVTESDVRAIETEARDPDIFRKIVASIAPSIYGLSTEKEALALQLFSGVPKLMPDGRRIRGDIHLLLVGDPGTAKSELLSYMSRLSPRGIYATGKAASAAGLTAAAVRDEFGEGRWTLEAGALVLADKGLACLHPASEVLVDGLPRPVESLFEIMPSERAHRNGQPIDISPLQAEVASFDLGRLSPVPARTSLIARRRYHGPILRIILDSGLTVSLTPDHLVLDGTSLGWKRLEDLRPSDTLVAAQRLPGRHEPVYLLDIVPENWIAALNLDEMRELEGHLLASFSSWHDACRAYGLRLGSGPKHWLLPVSQLRRLLKNAGLYETWRHRVLAFGRARFTERLRTSTITPELAYLLGFIQGDGHVSVTRKRSSVTVLQSTSHLGYIQHLQQMTKKVTSRPWGMYGCTTRSQIRGRATESRGYHMFRGSRLLAFLYGWLKAGSCANVLRLDDEALRGYIAGIMDSDGCISVRTSSKNSKSYRNTDVEFLFSANREENERFLYALRRFDIFARLRQGRGVYRVQITSRSDVDRLLECISPYSAKWKQIPRPKHGTHGRHGEAPALPVLRILAECDVRPSELLAKGLWSTFYDIRAGRRRPFKDSLARLRVALQPRLTDEAIRQLTALSGSDYALEHIAELHVDEHDGYVYDLRVPATENFVAGGIVSHNCIDEIDKMNPNDRSAIHEALEQQRISVAKAGITAVLQARCSVLAAANPKFGRFDEHKYIAEQIDLPPTLLSRFDAIFSLIDRPESARDANLADYIIRGHLVGEWLRRREAGEAVPEADVTMIEPYAPHFDPTFLRKYVAYAKRLFPVMTPESMETIKAKYLEIRKTGEAEGASVPITPRQLEAIIRFSEASSRARLSNVVEDQDAERAVRINEYWMRKIAGEEGRFDIDIVQVGISQSQRDQIIALRDIIQQLSGETGAADYEEIVRIAGDRGIAPARVDAWLKRWSQEGEVFSPAKDKYKLVERL